MRKFIYLLFLASITAMAVGCSDNIIEENRVLDLDEVEVTFTDAKQSKLIKVTTDVNNSFVVVWVGDNWGEAKVEEGNVIINVDANKGKEDRVSTVTVTLVKGGIMEKIEVKQNGAESSLGALPDDLFFNQLAGRKEITIFTNQSDWKAAFPAEEWASVIVDREKGVITVDILENDLEEDRTFTITLSSAAAGLTKDIKVTQSAMLTYILPYLKLDATGSEVIAFEEGRGSSYNGGRTPYMFRTLSPIMHNMYYQTDEFEAYYIIQADSYYKKDLFDKEVYTKLIAKNGYEFLFIEPFMSQNLDLYWNESEKTSGAIFNGSDKAQFAAIGEKPNNPIQDKPIPSFDSYPFGFHKMTASFDEVKAWEAANGGTLNEETSTYNSLIFLLPEGGPVIARIYIIDGALGLSGVTRVVTVYPDISKVMYQCLYTNIITNEFKALLTTAGWEQHSYSKPDTQYFYFNTAKNLTLNVYDVVFGDLPGWENKFVLCLAHTPLTTTIPSGLPSVLSGSKVLDSKTTPFREKKSISLRQLAQ